MPLKKQDCVHPSVHLRAYRYAVVIQNDVVKDVLVADEDIVDVNAGHIPADRRLGDGFESSCGQKKQVFSRLREVA